MHGFSKTFYEFIGSLKRGSPFSETDAFADILSMADEKGEFYSTTRKLMNRWGWGSGKTVSFIKKLEEQNIIGTQTERKRNTLYRINTEFIATKRNTNGTQTERKQNTKQDEYTEIIKRIIEYLNQKCETKYRHGSDANKKYINARLNDGYTIEDFFKVIDKKYNEWQGTEREKYLTPETLFGNKFEKYLNQKIIIDKPKNQFNNFKQNEYDFDELEKELLRNGGNEK